MVTVMVSVIVMDLIRVCQFRPPEISPECAKPNGQRRRTARTQNGVRMNCIIGKTCNTNVEIIIRMPNMEIITSYIETKMPYMERGPTDNF